MKLGFVGLGIMGRPMALNLIRAGTHCACTAAAPSPCGRWNRRARRHAHLRRRRRAARR